MTETGKGERMTDIPAEKKYHPAKEFVQRAYDSLLKPPESVCVPSWKGFAELVGGLRPYEYTLFCGPTGAGKSAWLASLVEQCATAGTKCFTASVENGPVDFVRRMISSRAGENWNEGQVIEQKLVTEFRAKNADFENIPVHITTYDDRVKNKEMMQQVKKAVHEEGCELVVLDNLNFFLEVTNHQQSVIELDRVTHEWIILCKELPAHVIMVCHPRKTEHGRVESEFDIKGSSTSVQEAHNVLLFNRISRDLKDKYPEFNWKNYRELKIAKCRRIGRGVGKRIYFFSKDGGRYIEDDPLAKQSHAPDPLPPRRHHDFKSANRVL